MSISPLHFFKYQGTGNDFVLFGPEHDPDSFSREAIRKLCDRHFGVGADGVLFASATGPGRGRMRMFNPDGSEAEMCGNGIRCVAKHLADEGLFQGPEIAIDTLAGPRLCRVFRDSLDFVSEVEVSMGRPNYARQAFGMAGAGRFVKEPVENGLSRFEGTAVSMGNPHLVLFTAHEGLDVEREGAALERHPAFANRTNVEFVEPLAADRLRVAVYERGAGITLACGTGACATVAAALIEERIRPDVPITVELPGGTLLIRFESATGEIVMRGPAVCVFRGVCEPSFLTE